MSKLAIKIYPDKILKKKTHAVEKIGKKERMLADDMIETMRHANGLGLAAPQVGVSKRIIVIEKMGDNGSALAIINPRILKKEGRSSFCEGCLSVPQVMSDIIRPESVIVEALNLKGEVVKIDTDGLLARVLQHEIDHLDGILFMDRVGFLKRKRILRQVSSKAYTKL